MMETKLERISQLSKQNPNMVFTSVGHLINEEMLIECHRDMDGDKAGNGQASFLYFAPAFQG